MKERSILFSTEMVKAILEGRKTETRRINKLDQDNKCGIFKLIDVSDEFMNCETTVASFRYYSIPCGTHNGSITNALCPYGRPGDLLWVRETWSKSAIQLKYGPTEFLYKASERIKFQWKPSIHMPKAAARIWLMVEDIRVERLHDITAESIVSEGIRIPVTNKGAENNGVLFELGGKDKAISFLPKGFGLKGAPIITQTQLLIAFWAELWCRINGRESYDSNPWVWVVKFKVLSTTGRPDDEEIRWAASYVRALQNKKEVSHA